jgi:PhnB protein
MVVRMPSLTPLLVVRDARSALAFYVEALGARELARFVDTQRGALSHADLCVGSAAFSITEETRGWNSDAPPSLGGSPVVLQLEVDDVDARVQQMCAAGAAIVFPLQEFCGERMARLRDPYGHLWIVSQRLEELSVQEKQQRRDELLARIRGGR